MILQVLQTADVSDFFGVNLNARVGTTVNCFFIIEYVILHNIILHVTCRQIKMKKSHNFFKRGMYGYIIKGAFPTFYYNSQIVFYKYSIRIPQTTSTY